MKIFRTGAYENFYDMPLKVIWHITGRCNYRCTYCFHYGRGGSASAAVFYIGATQSGGKKYCLIKSPMV